jgi:hypothetical protein
MFLGDFIKNKNAINKIPDILANNHEKPMPSRPLPGTKRKKSG